MKPTELAEQVDIEFEAIQLTRDEIASLRRFALQADASTRPTGIQPWEMTMG